MCFHTPPRNQGQIVLISYGCDDGHVIRQTYDQSNNTYQYHISRMRDDDDGDYWNGAPRNNRWRRLTHAEMRDYGFAPQRG